MVDAIHRCHFPGCTTPTPRGWLYGEPHWSMVPLAIQRQISASYNALPHGPEGECLKLSQEWVDAVQAAEAAIKTKLAEDRRSPKDG